MLSGGKSKGDGVGQILSGLGSLLSGNREGNGVDLGSVLEAVSSSFGQNQPNKKDAGHEESGMNFDSMMNLASLFMGQGNNAEGLMGLLPMILDSVSSGDNSHHNDKKKHDHSDHSWWVPPILENMHVMWDHFR